MAKKNRNKHNTNISNELEVNTMENRELINEVVSTVKPQTKKVLTTRDRIRQELVEMDMFDSTLQHNIDTLIGVIREYSTFAETNDFDTKAVKAYKNKRLKRFNVIVKACIRDLTAMDINNEENDTQNTLEEISDNN